VIPRISHADILLKRGRARNEMNDYRYDVVLHIGEESHVSAAAVSRWQADTFEIDQIVSHLEEQKLDAVQIAGVPNLRVAKDVAAWRLLNSTDAQVSASRIREITDRLDTKSVDPETFLSTEPRAGGARKATDPLAAAHKQQLALSLSTLLRESLPATQQPAAVLVVDQIPASADALLSAQ
jgi:hypothetical protein